jgi:DNA-binding transcriptional MerR regulator
MFKIGDFSKLGRVSVVALRHYDEIGLLKPAIVDTATGYRYYTIEQMPQLYKIVALKDLGFSLTEIANLLADNLPFSEYEGMLRLKKMQVQKMIKAETTRLERIETRLKLLKGEKNMLDSEVVIKSLPAQQIASIRTVIATPKDLDGVVKILQTYLREQGVKVQSGFLILHDPDFREENMDIEFAIPVDALVTENDQIKSYTLPAVPMVACAAHSGTPESYFRLYRSFSQWLADNGYKISGNIRDIPVTPDSNPSTWYGETQIPVEKL